MSYLDDLLFFIKLADCGSYVQAGKSLDVSHSTVVRKIQALEKKLNTDLLVRDSFSFKLTEAGRMLYRGLQEPFQRISNEILKLTNITDTPFGDLNILLPPGISINLITPHLVDFSRLFPQVNLHLSYVDAGSMIAKYKFDLAVVSNVPSLQSFKIRKLLSIPSFLVCSKAYADKYGLPKSPDELKSHFVVGYHNDNFERVDKVKLIHKDTKQEVLLELPNKITTDNYTHNYKLLESGEVIVPLTNYEMQYVDLNEVHLILPDYIFYTHNFYMIRHTHGNNVNVKVFIDFILDRVRKLH